MEKTENHSSVSEAGRRVSPALRCLYNLIVKIETIVCYVFFIAGTVALVVDIFGREVLGQGVFGAQRVAVYCMAVAGIMGFSYVVSHGGHLRPTVLDKLVPQKLDAFAARLADLLSCLLCLGLAYASYLFIYSTYSIGERDMTLPINIWTIQSVLVFAFGFAAIKFLMFVVAPALRPVTSGGDI